MKSYAQKTALITGASSGIGEAFAENLAHRGAKLILTARRRERLDALAARLRRDGADVMVIVDDLNDPEAPRRLWSEIETQGRTVDVLINNAGFGSGKRFEQEESRTFEQMIDVNVRALVALTHLFLPGMLQRGDGAVINVASTVAFQPMPFMAVYGASKAFVLSFSEALWGECEGTGVNVLALCPGYTASEFHTIAGLDVAGVPMSSPKQVVEEGLRALLRSRSHHIVGTANYLLAQASRFSSRQMTTRIARRIAAGRIAKETRRARPSHIVPPGTVRRGG